MHEPQGDGRHLVRDAACLDCAATGGNPYAVGGNSKRVAGVNQQPVLTRFVLAATVCAVSLVGMVAPNVR